ncbi:MAG: hypothetical protein K5981_07385, partial [Clostridia bacterium]|nr:hypothetical protein [Clostridia bacterium]
MRKRFGWLMLMALLCLALLPAAVYAEGGDPAEPAVWDAIGQLEDERLPQDATEDDYAALAPEVEALVTARADYVEGSARYEDGCLFWELTDGWTYAYFPSVRALNRNMPAEKAESSRAEKDAESEKDGGALMGGG